MRRLYFLIPEADTARKVVDELLLERIPERQIHVVAKDHQLLRDNDIPEAGLLQERDIVPAVERGLTAGGATGLLAGVVAVSFPPTGLALGGGALLATTLAGAAFGAVVGPMIGISVPNSQLEQFQTAIEEGQLLLIVDVPRDEVEHFTKLVHELHPEVDIEGTEPTMPPFP